MRKNLTEIVFILDRSGSMSGLEADTIGGFNSMIEKQKKENGEALISIAFTVRNPSAVSEKLLISATENARAKAEILCKASGGTLGQLLNIDYNWGELNVYSRTSYEVEDCIQPLMAMSKCAAPEIEPVDIDVTDTVAFTWEIQ